MAQVTVAFLEAVVGEIAHLVGSCDGATMALPARYPGPNSFAAWLLLAGVFTAAAGRP